MPEIDPPLPALTVPQLSYLVAVASHATFSEAAASLGVTTSALSQGLSELERRVGVDLFERVGRRQVLRPEAEEVLAYAAGSWPTPVTWPVGPPAPAPAPPDASGWG